MPAKSAPADMTGSSVNRPLGHSGIRVREVMDALSSRDAQTQVAIGNAGLHGVCERVAQTDRAAVLRAVAHATCPAELATGTDGGSTRARRRHTC